MLCFSLFVESIFFVHDVIFDQLIISSIVRLAGPYRYINRLSILYVSNRTIVPTHDMMEYIDKLAYTTHTGLLSDQYIPPMPGNMSWYGKP